MHTNTIGPKKSWEHTSQKLTLLSSIRSPRSLTKQTVRLCPPVVPTAPSQKDLLQRINFVHSFLSCSWVRFFCTNKRQDRARVNRVTVGKSARDFMRSACGVVPGVARGAGRSPLGDDSDPGRPLGEVTQWSETSIRRGSWATEGRIYARIRLSYVL